MPFLELFGNRGLSPIVRLLPIVMADSVGRVSDSVTRRYRRTCLMMSSYAALT